MMEHDGALQGWWKLYIRGYPTKIHIYRHALRPNDRYVQFEKLFYMSKRILDDPL